MFRRKWDTTQLACLDLGVEEGAAVINFSSDMNTHLIRMNCGILGGEFGLVLIKSRIWLIPFHRSKSLALFVTPRQTLA